MKYFLIFSNCIITKGYNRSTICDLQKKQLYFIPNEIYDIILDLKTKPLLQLKDELDENSQPILFKYIEYFLEQKIGFYCDNPEFFPDINLNYFAPELINNAILDWGSNSPYDILKIIDELIILGCKFLEIRIYDEVSIQKLQNAFELISTGFFRNVDIICKYPNNNEDLCTIKQFVSNFPIIGTLTLHSAPKASISDNPNIKLSHEVIIDQKSCGKILMKYFSLDIKTISESQNHNTCLNQKISIDIDGNIKNCPSMLQNFGNIKSTKLSEVILNEEFKRKWTIKKDNTNGCKICEFRYVCTDCRAYLEDPNDDYSKPLKCGYDPKTNKWEDWTINPLKKEAIKYYNLSSDTFN